MTILDACVQALDGAKEPLPPERIHKIIVDKGLYTFRAKDPVGVVRSALRRHVRSGDSGKVVQVSPGLFRKA